MKFVFADGCWVEDKSNWITKTNLIQLNTDKIKFNDSGKVKVAVVDIEKMKSDLKKTIEYIKVEWFGGKLGLREGVFWTAFMTYLFPWFLDIAKVYCAIMVCQAFYKERKGNSETSGMQALVYYGKWFLIFNLIPWAVELIDQIGHKMQIELINKGLPSS